jgi:hypothetical protein
MPGETCVGVQLYILVQYQYPAGPDGETAVELAVNPALFREAFAADLPAETTALMAATQ